MKTTKDHCRLTKIDLQDNEGPFWKWMHDDFLHLSPHDNIYPIQKKVIRGIELCEDQGSNNFLTVIPTSGGKSAIFQAPILYKAIKKGNNRISLVITPLQALMQEQVEIVVNRVDDSFKNKVDYIHSGRTAEDIWRIKERIKKKEIVLLYITPERLMNEHFWEDIIEFILGEEGQGFETIVFDEAHCVVSWGMGFRPDYICALRKCLKIQEKDPEVSIQMYSATIPARSRMELINEIQIPETHIYPSREDQEYINTLYPIKEYIDIMFERVSAPEDSKGKATVLWENKCRLLKDHLIDSDGSNGFKRLHKSLCCTPPSSRIIIFTRYVEETQRLKEFLSNNLLDTCLGQLAHKIDAFHAQLPGQEKGEIKRKFQNGDIVILISTKAFGMGMDIPNIHGVFHMTPPAFLEDYLQEVGRAGRDKNSFMNALDLSSRDSDEHIMAWCFYSNYDLELNAPDTLPKKEVSWLKIIDTYNCIKQYINNGRHPKVNGFFPVPANILEFSDSVANDSIYDLRVNKKRKPYEDLTETFNNCVNWLSKSEIIDGHVIGLNRIDVGFKCPRYYEVEVNPNKKEIRTNDKNLLHFFEYIQEKVKKTSSYSLLVDANDVLSDNNYDFYKDEDKRNKEVETLINACYEHRVFLRNNTIIQLAINKNIRKIVANCVNDENGLLLDLEILCEMLRMRKDQDDLNQLYENSLESLKDKGMIITRSPEAEEGIFRSWGYFCSLSYIYTVDEIKQYCYLLLKALYNNKSRKRKWTDLASDIGLEHDPEAVKLFAIALERERLDYVTNWKQIEPRDHIQIRLIENRPKLIREPLLPNDKQAKQLIDDYYAEKHKKTLMMREIIERYENPIICKNEIVNYSKKL